MNDMWNRWRGLPPEPGLTRRGWAVVIGLLSLGLTWQPRPVLAAEAVAIEGVFGRAVVDVDRPCLSSLTLRRADGSLEPQSLLSPKGAPWQRGMFDWGTQALTYVVDETGRRFESRNQAAATVERTASGVILRGIMLTDVTGDAAAREEWQVYAEGDDLVWAVDRVWLRPMKVSSAGTPALFFSTRPVSGSPATVLPNALATTFWIDPGKLRGWHNPFYRPAAFPAVYKMTRENNVVVAEPGGWAVLKLFSSWPNEREPRFSVTGGHLYRRGHFGWLSEAGIVSQPTPVCTFRDGDTERTTLRLSAVSANTSGHQLAVEADDPSGTVAALRTFYGALFNGGAVNDPLHYCFGNETDGWYYGGASWMKGLPLLAGAPSPSPASAYPHSLARAFRDNLGMILGTEYEPGLTRFGYNTTGGYTDDNLNQILGGRAYYLYSGDLAFVRQHLPAYHRAVAWYLDKFDRDGLVALPGVSHWYYDAMSAAGVTTYHNAFLYRALIDLAGMDEAAGNDAEATRLTVAAAALKEAINRVLWWEDAPGGPRYVDWILPDGSKIAYAADLCQFPPVAFGIAEPVQAKALIATLDRRIAELARDDGYAGLASLSAYWPVPALVNSHPANQGFGNYMNGGSFLCMTYWEIMARAAAGDAEGAWDRLQRFAAGIRLSGEHGYIGNNWVTQDGRIGPGACDEPYLSDMIAVPAALVQGILGICHTNTDLEVHPVLPPGLSKITVDVVHLGIRKRVVIDGTKVTIRDLGRAFSPPEELTWHMDAGAPPEAEIAIDRTFDMGSAWTATPEISFRHGIGVALQRVPTGPLLGFWPLDDPPVDGLVNRDDYSTSARCIGSVVFGIPDRHGRPAAARFEGGAHVAVTSLAPFVFKPTQSFTIQAWFQTVSAENQVIAARPGAYSLGVKGRKLSAWVMQDGGHYVETVGAADAADGQWHHAAAVYDRESQTLSVFLDGIPDGTPQNIDSVGSSSSGSPLTLGSFGSGFPFLGALDDVSIHSLAIRPSGFSFNVEYVPVTPQGLGALMGRYVTSPCDWGQLARLTRMRTRAEPNDGAISVRLETSNDAFTTLASSRRLDVQEGDRIAVLGDVPPAREVRLAFTMTTPPTARISPVVHAVELTAEPLSR